MENPAVDDGALIRRTMMQISCIGNKIVLDGSIEMEPEDARRMASRLISMAGGVERVLRLEKHGGIVGFVPNRETQVTPVTISGCARCNDQHIGLEFTPFIQAIDGGPTHYAMCPITEEPIFMTAEPV